MPAVGNKALPTVEYLLTCSRQSLQELELNCLNRAQQCLKAARREWEEAVTQRGAADVTRWLLEHRDEIRLAGDIIVEERGAALLFPAPQDTR